MSQSVTLLQETSGLEVWIFLPLLISITVLEVWNCSLVNPIELFRNYLEKYADGKTVWTIYTSIVKIRQTLHSQPQDLDKTLIYIYLFNPIKQG